MWWLILLVIITILYIIVIAVDFSRRRTGTFMSALLNKPLLADLDLVTTLPFQPCYNAFP